LKTPYVLIKKRRVFGYDRVTEDITDIGVARSVNDLDAPFVVHVVLISNDIENRFFVVSSGRAVGTNQPAFDVAYFPRTDQIKSARNCKILSFAREQFDGVIFRRDQFAVRSERRLLFVVQNDRWNILFIRRNGSRRRLFEPVGNAVAGG
jgi:hypothetical protein